MENKDGGKENIKIFAPKTSKEFLLVTVIAIFIIVGVLATLFVARPLFRNYLYGRTLQKGRVDDSLRTPVFSETANWKTYRNEKSGFEFKYPQDWTLLDGINAIYVAETRAVNENKSPTIDFPNLEIEFNNPQIYFVEHVNPNPTHIFRKEGSQEQQYGPSDRRDIIIKFELGRQWIYANCEFDSKKPEFINFCNQIIGSMTLINGGTRDETADWKTYRNQLYGFEFKYSPDWDLGNNLLSVMEEQNGFSYTLPDSSFHSGFSVFINDQKTVMGVAIVCDKPIIKDLTIASGQTVKIVTQQNCLLAEDRDKYGAASSIETEIPVVAKDVGNRRLLYIRTDTTEKPINHFDEFIKVIKSLKVF